MKLAELIRGMATPDETYAIVAEIMERMWKTTVTSVKDMPGFIVNRVPMPYINEACRPSTRASPPSRTSTRP